MLAAGPTDPVCVFGALEVSPKGMRTTRFVTLLLYSSGFVRGCTPPPYSWSYTGLAAEDSEGARFAGRFNFFAFFKRSLTTGPTVEQPNR